MQKCVRPQPVPHGQKPRALGAVVLTAAVFSVSVWSSLSSSFVSAGKSTSGGKPADFATILETHTRKTFRVMSEYVAQNPKAEDVERAYQWLFETARKHGLEADAISIANEYVNRDQTLPRSRTLALYVLSLGLAKSGKLKEALEGFTEHLRSAGIRSPDATLGFATSLVAQAQLAGESGAAREIYERFSNKFFLNPFVRKLCENRLVKLELVDRTAPEISAVDLAGKPVELADFQGKVLLVDFWSRNCLPCLTDFPGMKQLYAEYHKQGLEVVGITLDEDREAVDAFQEQWKLPWRLSMSQNDREKTQNRYRVRSIPSLFLIDRKGRVAYVDLRGDDLRQAVEHLLDGKQ